MGEYYLKVCDNLGKGEQLIVKPLSEHEANVKAEILNEVWNKVVEVYDNDTSPNVSDYMDYQLSLRDIYKIIEQLNCD